MELAERVLDGEAGGPVDERERRLALRVLHLRAVPHVLVPVLVLVAGVGGREDDGVVAHGEAVRLVGAAEDPEQRLLVRRRGLVVPAVAVVVVVPEHASFPFLKLRPRCEL